MAHELSFRQDGTAEAFFALKPAWHGLGTVLPHVPDSQEAMKAAGLDWSVNTVPIQTIGGEECPDHVATVRSDNGKVLGVVGSGYSVVQNHHAFAFLDSLLQDGIVRYESAGALRDGRIVWALARLPSVTDEIAPGDNSNRFILFSTSHDGSKRLHAIPTSVRVVCANTLRIATATDVGIRHSGNTDVKLEYAKQYLSQFDAKFTLYRDNARKLAQRQFTPDQAREYIATLFPEVATAGRSKSIRDNKVQDVRRALVSDRQRIPSIRGTWWALYNAVSESIDHDTRRDYRKLHARENKFLNVLEGSGADFKANAFKVALEMAS